MSVGQMLTVRFTETQWYDINDDEEVVRFMAITGKGTFYAQTPLIGSKNLREKRAQFKDDVIEFMQSGYDGGEIDLG